LNIQFIGPASLATDGGVDFTAKLNHTDLVCHFSYEALEDIDADSFMGDAIDHFSKHKLKLLSIAEQKILNGHAHDGKIQIFSNDLVSD
jgi:hypothetical protein